MRTLAIFLRKMASLFQRLVPILKSIRIVRAPLMEKMAAKFQLCQTGTAALPKQHRAVPCTNMHRVVAAIPFEAQHGGSLNPVSQFREQFECGTHCTALKPFEDPTESHTKTN